MARPTRVIQAPPAASVLSTGGVAVAPAANAPIATLTTPAAGSYEVRAYCSVSGNNPAVGDLNNFELRKGATPVASPLAQGAGQHAETLIGRVDLDGATNLSINVTGAGTASIEYGALLVATRVG